MARKTAGRQRTSGAVLTALFLGAAVTTPTIAAPLPSADLGVGDRAPKIEAKKLFNTKTRSLDQLRGQLLLLEFYAHW